MITLREEGRKNLQSTLAGLGFSWGYTREMIRESPRTIEEIGGRDSILQSTLLVGE